jgi:hypothetical protein
MFAEALGGVAGARRDVSRRRLDSVLCSIRRVNRK